MYKSCSNSKNESLPTTHLYNFECDSDQSLRRMARKIKRMMPVRWLKRYLMIGGGIILFLLLVYYKLHLVRDTWYLFRPFYDKRTEFHELPHFSDFRLKNDKLCALHNWTVRPSDVERPKVIDAVIFSVELDLLEIRLKELWSVVDYFIVLEADRTFHGKQKRLELESHIDRFAWSKSKLKNYVYNGLVELEPGESPFANEERMRRHMNQLVRQFARPGDIILVTDVDEIPRQSTVELFMKCTGFPSTTHLALKTYFYSFEFFFSFDDSWRAKVVLFDRYFSYSHGKQSNYILADAGWHCTFCFRYLRDFRFKMKSYSHNDRLMNRQDLLEDNEIQRRACLGLDLFDMYPEVYSYKELFSKMGPIQKTNSYIDLPLELLLNNDRYLFLLKGNCIREDFVGTLDWN